MPEFTNAKDEFVWIDDLPPSSAGRPKQWASRLAPLMEQPGQWAMFTNIKPSSTTVGSYPDGTTKDDWQFATRTNGDGRRHLYARYLPAAESAAA